MMGLMLQGTGSGPLKVSVLGESYRGLWALRHKRGLD